MLYATNVGDADLGSGNAMTKLVAEFARAAQSETVIVSAQVEAELCELPLEERMDFLESLGVVDDEQCGLKVGWFVGWMTHLLIPSCCMSCVCPPVHCSFSLTKRTRR